MDLWERQAGEPPKAYQAFLLYRDFGVRRSIQSVWELHCAERQKSPTKAPGCWKKWSSLFSWVERADAYDGRLRRMEQDAFDAKLRELVERRMTRELKVQGDLEALADKLLPKLEKLADMPPTTIEQIKYDDTGLKIVSKSKIRGVAPSQMARLIDTYIDLQARTVHGLMRISRSIRVAEESAKQQNVIEGPVVDAELVTDE